MTVHWGPLTTSGGTTCHTHTITYTEARGFDTWTPTPKETPMTTLQKIVAERKEAKERERLEAAVAAWDEVEIDKFDWSTVGRFEWKPKDKIYIYACVKTENGWYVTGRDCGALDDDDFIAFLVERDVTPADIDWMDPF